MLERLDLYFIENNLYQCANYQQIVENIILSSNFSVAVDTSNSLKIQNRAGEYQSSHETQRTILINPEHLLNETQLEGVLCHEFIHHLTNGNNVIEYTKNNESHKATLPHIPTGGNAEVGGTDLITEANGNTRVEYFESHREQIFINEGLTEFIKQQIYSRKESAWAYEPQTQMMSFVVDLFGESAVSDFFSGNLETISSHFSKQEWSKFLSATTAFQRIDARRFDWPNSQYYITAQDIVVNSVLQELTSNLDKININELVRVLSIIKGDAPLTPIDRQRYDKQCTEIINKFCTQASINPQQMRKLIAKTVVAKADQKQNIFQTNLSNNSVLIKQTSAGFSLSMDEKKFVYSYQFPTTSGTSVEHIADDGWRYNITNNGNNVYTIVFSNKTLGQEETIKLTHNESSIIIADKESQSTRLIDFDKEKKKRSERIQENSRLLNNPKYIEAVNFFVSQGQKVSSIKEVTANNGKKYLIVTKSGEVEFFSMEGNHPKKINITDQAKSLPSMPISKKSTLVGSTQTIYHPTNEQTNQMSIQYTLEDGTILVKYSSRAGKDLYAEREHDVLIEKNNSSIYSSSNSDLVGVFDSSYFKHEIRRDVSRTPVRTETQTTKSSDETRQRQEEFDRKRAEIYKQQRMTQEQQRERDKHIEDERTAQQQRADQAKAQFEKTRAKVEESEYFEDEYGVIMRRNPQKTQQQQYTHSFSRGR